jgi:protocatechuate 3,4-dioxygenase beta subunit
MFKILFDFWYLPFLFSSLFSGGEEWRTLLSPQDTNAGKIIVSGTVFKEDGKTPAEGMTVYVYQTGSDGIYGKGDNRIDGTMITNSEGQYEFQTTKPGAYPGGGNPAHIHYKITGNGYSEQWFELKFHGDKYLKESHYKKEEGKGKFSEIQKPVNTENGFAVYRMDIKLEK